MGTNIDVGKVQKHEGPPPYFSVVVSQPEMPNQGYSNTDDFVPEKGYSFGPPGSSVFPASNVLIGPAYYRNVLEEVLAAHAKFTFHQSEKIKHVGNNTPTICQIRGSLNQPVMSALQTTTSITHHNNKVNSSLTTIQFADPTGTVLLTIQETGEKYEVSSGGKLVGLLDGVAFSNFPPKRQMRGLNSNGDVVFQTVVQGKDLNFLVNGAIVAVARKTCRKTLGLDFIAPVDAHAKAMIIAGSYYLFISLHTDTAFRRNGPLTLARVGFLILVIIFLIFCYWAGSYFYYYW